MDLPHFGEYKVWIFLRKKKRQKRFSFITSIFNKDGGEILHDKSHFDHPGILMENKEKARILFSVIEQLSENQKTAFILFIKAVFNA